MQNTNIVRLVELLKKDDPNQLVYYQVGVTCCSDEQTR
jgi:uncharacterized protein (DUF2235 family)